MPLSDDELAILRGLWLDSAAARQQAQCMRPSGELEKVYFRREQLLNRLHQEACGLPIGVALTTSSRDPNAPDASFRVVYVVWWRTAGEGIVPAGPLNWVGAWTERSEADHARVMIKRDWVETGIEMLLLDSVRFH